MFKNKIYVPNNNSIRKDILASRHDNMAAGHPGQFRTLELVNRKYYWKSLKKSVTSYVSHCESCIRNKHSNQLPPGLLNPIELPSRPWDHINYNLITGLPESEGFDTILTVVDRMSRMVHFIPTTSRASAVDVVTSQ
ncbi:Transposon Tf2-1 polyprotein [Ceratobasidium sp. AG-Ba]|nr:Transposon Tf2-1 polyprotein [Ceratobasidium sp. AG-Ba]